MSGETIDFEGDISDEQLRQRLIDLGTPEPMVDFCVSKIKPENRASFFASNPLPENVIPIQEPDTYDF